METVIEYKGRIHIFKCPPCYTEKMFLDRSWYIVKNINVPCIEAYADIWVAHKYLQTEYENNIMEKIAEYEKNTYV